VDSGYDARVQFLNMDPASQRELKVLTEIAEQGHVTQRGLSRTLGIPLGLTNPYLKRLAARATSRSRPSRQIA
jgi:hypothetical protein